MMRVIRTAVDGVLAVGILIILAVVLAVEDSGLLVGGE